MLLIIGLVAALFSSAHLQESQDPDVVDLGILLDTSKTMSGSKFELTVNYLTDNLINLLNIQNSRIRIGLINYGETTEILYRFREDQDRQKIKDAIKGAKQIGGISDLSKAFTETRRTLYSSSEGERTNARNLVILFTDGVSSNFGRSLRSAMLLKQAGVGIVIVTVGSYLNEIEINEMASDPKDSNVIAANKFENMGEISNKLTTLIRDDTRPCQSGPCQNNGNCVNMPNNFICFCPTNYVGRTCQYRSTKNYDIVISIDSSSSIKQENFFELLEFVRYFAGSLPTSDSRFRVGLQTFSTNEIKRFDLNEYDSTFDLFQAINFPYELGHTDTAQAFRAIRENMFVPGLGDRSNFENVVIYLSDGHSRDRSLTFNEAALLHAAGIRVMGIGIAKGNKYNEREMAGIASNPDSRNLFIVEKYSDLTFAFADDVIQKLVDENDECSGNPCQNGDCMLESGTYRCECDPQTRSGRNCNKNCFGLNDIVFAIDTSNSIRENRLPILKNVVKGIIDESNVHTASSSRVGVISFSDVPKIEFHLNTYATAQDIKQRIDMIKFSRGKTNIADTFIQVRQMFTPENGTRTSAQKFLYIITDGLPTLNVNQTTIEAVNTRISGVTVIVISPEQEKERLWLKAIASQPYDRFIYATKTYSELTSIVTAASDAICDRINECDTTNCQNGGQCANSFGRVMCFCTQRFTGDRCERECTTSQDVVFILDRSGSVETYFELQMKLARKIIWGLNFDSGRSRVGVVTFSDTARSEFYLDAYTDSSFPPPIRPKLHALDATAFIKTNDKKTNIAAALEFTRNEMFRSDRGDRNTRNIAILMTDGKPNLQENRMSSEASSLKGSARLMTVGIGENVDSAKLDDAASTPKNENRFNLSNDQQISDVSNQILNEICK